MFKKKCACGESEKSFKFDIGPFFIDECCKKAGYDCHGKRQEDYEREAEEMANQLLEDPQEEKSVGQIIADKAKEGVNKILQSGLSDEQKEKMKSLEKKVINKPQVVDFKSMTAKELIQLCEETNVKYSKRDTKKKLIERLTK